MTADAKLLAELKEYFERLKHRADVRGGPDVSAMGIAEEAIQLIDAALASPRYVLTRASVLEEAAKECDALGRMAPNNERGLAYDIAAKCIRDLKGQ
jgi:hypothetical protein